MVQKTVIPDCGSVHVELIGDDILIGQSLDYSTSSIKVPAVMLSHLIAGLNEAHADWLEAKAK